MLVELKSWKALRLSNGWELQTRGGPATLFRPGIAEFDFGHAGWTASSCRLAEDFVDHWMRLLATNGDQRQGSGDSGVAVTMTWVQGKRTRSCSHA